MVLLLTNSAEDVDVDVLKIAIIDFFEAAMVEDVLILPCARQKLTGEVYESTRVLSKSYDETGHELTIHGLFRAIARLRWSVKAR